MKTKEFKLLPCIFCTIGYNCYVVGYNVTAKTYQSLAQFQNIKPTIEDKKQSQNKP